MLKIEKIKFDGNLIIFKNLLTNNIKMTFTAPSTQMTLPSPPRDNIPPDFEISDENAKQLYYHIRTKGTKVYDMNRNYLGSHTGYAAIAHDGVSTGTIYIENDGNGFWISGMAVHIDNVGLFLV